VNHDGAIWAKRYSIPSTLGVTPARATDLLKTVEDV